MAQLPPSDLRPGVTRSETLVRSSRVDKKLIKRAGAFSLVL